MSVVPVGSRASSSRDNRSRDRNTTPPRRTPIVEEPDSDSTATPLVYSPQVPAPDPSNNMSAAAFVAGSAVQRALIRLPMLPFTSIEPRTRPDKG